MSWCCDYVLKVGLFHFARPLERTDFLLYSGAWHGPSKASKLLWRLTFLMEWCIMKETEAEGQSDSLDQCCIFTINLFVWLCWVLVVAHGVFSCSMWGPVPWPEIESGPPELGARSLSHWTTMEVPLYLFKMLTEVKCFFFHWLLMLFQLCLSTEWLCLYWVTYAVAYSFSCFPFKIMAISSCTAAHRQVVCC